MKTIKIYSQKILEPVWSCFLNLFLKIVFKLKEQKILFYYFIKIRVFGKLFLKIKNKK